MGYAKISPIRRPPALRAVGSTSRRSRLSLAMAGRLLVFCTTLLYGALSAEEYLGAVKTRMTF